jgi:pimeloyl-ACP methyl ester carboxylesterase
MLKNGDCPQFNIKCGHQPVTRQYCHIGTRTIAYLDSAPGNATLRTYVLLHAFPIGANLWEPQMRSIPAGWRLITPDLRGFGGSTEGDSVSGMSMSDYAVDVVELGIARVVIGGASMGGYATLAFVQSAGDRVDGVVLANTRAGADSPEARANRRNMLALVDREGPSGVAREMMPKLLGKTTRETNPGIEANVRRLIKQQSPIAVRAAIHRMMHRPDSTPLLAQISAPTLVVTGEEDELIPIEESQAIAAAVTGATLVVIPRAGHLSNLEQPDAFNNALHAFLTKL